MEKIQGFNKVNIVGNVVNYTIYKFKSGKRKAEIGIKDELTNNVCYAQMFENNNMTYDGRSVNLDTLKRIFLDGNDKPRGVLVKCTGRVSENRYISTKSGEEVVSTKPTLWRINPYNDLEDQQVTFNITGIVENIKTIKDDTEVVIRIGIPTTNKDKEFNGIEFLTVYADGNIKEKIEDADIDKGYQISVAGDILNKLPKRDKYGDVVEGSVAEKGFKIMSLKKKIVEPDDLDMDLYNELKAAIKQDKSKDNKSNKKQNEDVSVMSDKQDLNGEAGSDAEGLDGLDF